MHSWKPIKIFKAICNTRKYTRYNTTCLQYSEKSDASDDRYLCKTIKTGYKIVVANKF